MTLNAPCFLSLCEDCARLAIEHGYEDLADPAHPLRSELDQLDAYDLVRVATFVQGASAHAADLAEGEPSDSPSFVTHWVVGSLLVAVAAIAAHFLFRS